MGITLFESLSNYIVTAPYVYKVLGKSRFLGSQTPLFYGGKYSAFQTYGTSLLSQLFGRQSPIARWLYEVVMSRRGEQAKY